MIMYCPNLPYVCDFFIDR